MVPSKRYPFLAALRRRNRNSCSLYRQNAFFDHSGRCGACKKQKMQDRVSGRMYDREKTNRFPSYGTESTWRGCLGKCIRPGWRMCQI